MNHRHLANVVLACASLASAAAFAAPNAEVVPAQFGRDGVPQVAVTRLPSPDVQHVQVFGRDVPVNRSAQRQGGHIRAELNAQRFGRS
ncbi:MAG: hypothetical protein IPK20_24175 [Betaproteobacteria bacterium]|nr:hypothetical protein [Betaproteobacteria bacterium]